MLDLNSIMNNSSNIYYGHGIGSYSKEKLDSIIQNGIRCSHGSLYFTSEVLGVGSQINEDVYEKLRNWEHADSKQIMIVSLPSKFNVLDTYGSGRYNKANSAFYYHINQEQKDNFGLVDGDYLMPEFILGYYDATNDTFTANSNYYEKLPPEQQNIIMEQVKKNYYDIVTEENTVDIQEYKEILDDIGWEFPLTDEDIEKYKNNSNIPKINSVETKRIQLPNGVSIPAKQYIEEIVNPLLTEDEVILQNWDTISKKQYIEQFVLGDTLVKYNGDFKKMLAETTLYEIKEEKKENMNSVEEIVSIYDYLSKYRYSNKTVAVITNKQYAIQMSDGTRSHDDMSRNLANSIFPNTETNTFGQSINLERYSIVMAAINNDVVIMLPKEKLSQSQLEIFDDVLQQIDKFNKETNSKVNITVFSSENIKLKEDEYTDNIQGLRDELKNFVTHNVDNVDENIVGIPFDMYQKSDNIKNEDNQTKQSENVSKIINENGKNKLSSEYFNINIEYIKDSNKEMYFDVGESLMDLALDEINNSGNFIERYIQILTEDCKTEEDINNLLRFLDDISKIGKMGKENSELLKQTTIISKDRIINKNANQSVLLYPSDYQIIYDDLYRQAILLNDLYDEQRKGNVDDEVLADLLHKYNTLKTNLAVLEGEIDPVQYQQLNGMIDFKISNIEQVLNFIETNAKMFGFTTNQFLMIFTSVIIVTLTFFLIIIFN